MSADAFGDGRRLLHLAGDPATHAAVPWDSPTAQIRPAQNVPPDEICEDDVLHVYTQLFSQRNSRYFRITWN